MKKNIFKRPFQCSLQTTIMSKEISFVGSKPSIEQVVKENIQLLQKPEDLPEEKILYEANGQEDDSSCQDEPPPPIPCQNLIKKLRKDKTPSDYDKSNYFCQSDKNTKPSIEQVVKENIQLLQNKKTKKEVSFDNNSTKEISDDNKLHLLSDDDLTKMIRLVKRMKKLKV